MVAPLGKVTAATLGLPVAVVDELSLGVVG